MQLLVQILMIDLNLIGGINNKKINLLTNSINNMSHFTVLIIGENPEEQLAPFDENLEVEFKDLKESYREEYENETISEFYCASHSSWGQQISKELFDLLKSSKVGRVAEYDVKKLVPYPFFTVGKKYKGYYNLENGKRCKGDAWFEVEDVLETTQPSGNVCSEGKILIKKIARPKKIAIKDKYPIYEDYLKYYHGLEDSSFQGYMYNPKAKWDWYQLGGRWTGFFKLKPKSKGELGSHGIMTSRVKPRTADQAYKKDIDFDGMRIDKFEESTATYDSFEKKMKNGDMNPGMAYFDFGIRNLGKDADHFIPETREQYLSRVAPITTFAVLKDGQWYEKGEMGWWGVVSNERDFVEWQDQFNKLLEELPDDTLLSVYDCHI